MGRSTNHAVAMTLCLAAGLLGGALASTSSSTETVDCNAPLITTQTGQGSTCPDSTNLHYWPANYGENDCHGWAGTDSTGKVHDNSAKNIKCTSNGIKYDQYAGNLDCSGNPVAKSFIINECHQGIPANLYDKARDISCCTDPTGSQCTNIMTGVPRVDSTGTTDDKVYKNGALCAAASSPTPSTTDPTTPSTPTTTTPTTTPDSSTSTPPTTPSSGGKPTGPSSDGSTSTPPTTPPPATTPVSAASPGAVGSLSVLAAAATFALLAVMA